MGVAGGHEQACDLAECSVAADGDGGDGGSIYVGCGQFRGRLKEYLDAQPGGAQFLLQMLGDSFPLAAAGDGIGED